MDIEKISLRIHAAQAYFTFLPESLRQPWSDLYDSYQTGNLSVPEALTLIHPYHYEHVNKKDIVRGKRAFENVALTPGRQCESLRIWGYECPWPDQSSLSADHEFPYSLGGPTIADNIRYLCPAHNRMKSNDIHFFPWEEGLPSWFGNTVLRIKRSLHV